MNTENPFLTVFTEGCCLSHLVHWSSARDVAALRRVHRLVRHAHTFMLEISLSGWQCEHRQMLRRIQKLTIACENVAVTMTGLDALEWLRELTLVHVHVSLGLLSTSVKRLTLRACAIGPDALQEGIRLDVLDWQRCTLAGPIARVLTKAHLSRAQDICVRGMKITPDVLESIGHTLRILDLGRVDLTDIPQALLQCVNLETLRLAFNHFHPDGKRALATAVAHLIRLTHIELTGCHIGDIQDLLNGLLSMKHLHLSDTHITGQSIPALAAVISRSPGLGTLYLGGNRSIGNDGAEILATALADRRKLCAVSFVDCGIGCWGHYSLRRALHDLIEYEYLYYSKRPGCCT